MRKGAKRNYQRDFQSKKMAYMAMSAYVSALKASNNDKKAWLGMAKKYEHVANKIA